MGAKREYITVFAIGAKLLSSFHGAMRQANARLEGLRRLSLSIGKSLLKLTTIVTGLGSALAGLAVAKLLSGVFQDAAEEAKRVQQRTAAMIADFMQLKEIQKGGTDEAERQLRVVMKQAEALGKNSVLHEEIYKTMAQQLAAGGVPPRQIKAMLGPMGELLVKSRGVAANEEDAAELAKATVRAIHGKTKAMQQFSVFIDAGRGKDKKTFEEIYEELLKIEKGYADLGIIAKAKLTPAGQIQLAKNAMRDLRKEIGERLIPLQARLAVGFLKMFPRIKPLLESGIDWLFGKLNQLLDYLESAQGAEYLAQLGSIAKKVGDALSWVVKNANWLIPTVLALVAAMWALQAVMLVVSAVTAIVEAPVILLIAAIAALVGMVIWAIVNWTSFRDTVLGVIATMENWINQIPVIGPLLNLFLFGPLKLIIKTIDWIIKHWGLIGKTISDTWEQIKAKFTAAWEFLKKGFTEVGKTILETMLKPVNKVVEQVNGMIDVVNKINPFAKIPHIPTVAIGGGGAAAAGAAAAPTAAAQAAAAQMPLSPEGLKAVQAERAGIIADLQRPELRNLVSATLATEAGGAEDQKNVLESLVNRAVSEKNLGTYKGIESMIKGGFYGPYNRGETAAVMAKGLSDARYQQVGSMIGEVAAGRNALGGLTDQGMVNEIHGAINERHGEDYYGLRKAAEANTAAFKYSRGYATGGIARTPQLATLAERGPEAIIPLGRGGGMFNSTMHFSPNITINGNASEAEQRTLEERLRSMAKDFIDQFKDAQYQERRLSYESTYG